MIYCFGDSITKGSPGVSYLKYLSSKKEFKNLGIGGETLSGLTHRLQNEIKKHDEGDYIIQIGTNDILLPYLEKQSPKWKKRLAKIKKRVGRPSSTELQFSKNYQSMVDLMKKENKKMLLISIPCIGEDLQNPRNQKVEKYNEIIQTIANKEGIPYVDYYGYQKVLLHEEQKMEEMESKHYFIGEEPKEVVFDIFRTRNQRGRRKLSKKRNLLLTVDGVHLNDEGAKGLAALVEIKIS